LADALVAGFMGYPGFERLQSIFAELLGSLMGPLAPEDQVPEELLGVRNMLATQAETWKQQWLQEGRQEGEVALLVRRFGALPGWAKDRIDSANRAALEEWGLGVLDVTRLEDVLA
jgi:hypothetical protein